MFGSPLPGKSSAPIAVPTLSLHHIHLPQAAEPHPTFSTDFDSSCVSCENRAEALTGLPADTLPMRPMDAKPYKNSSR